MLPGVRDHGNGKGGIRYPERREADAVYAN
jgi:hypothetical protein